MLQIHTWVGSEAKSLTGVIKYTGTKASDSYWTKAIQSFSSTIFITHCTPQSTQGENFSFKQWMWSQVHLHWVVPNVGACMFSSCHTNCHHLPSGVQTFFSLFVSGLTYQSKPLLEGTCMFPHLKTDIQMKQSKRTWPIPCSHVFDFDH